MEEKKNRIYKTIMLVVLTAFITFMLTSFWMYSNNYNNNVINLPETSISQEGNESNSYLEKYLKNIKTIIDKTYLWKDKINEEDLQKGAIEGYVQGLGDEYTEYIPQDEMKEYTENIVGNFVGIGIYMVSDEKSGRVVVYYPIPGSPAEKAGIKAGDKIIEVNGKEYTSEDFENIASFIKGEEGTKVNLVIERDNEKLNFEITREKINTNPITIKKFENDIGYIKIPSFDENTSKDFEEKVNELKKDNIKCLIIDLRNNGGGILDEATKVADMLLNKDLTIISTTNNKGEKKVTKSKEKMKFDMSLIVLTNENSASASEVLACSLKDNNRAKIVGEKTYGKGVIQALLTLRDGSGLKITSEEYYTPNGDVIHKKGIEPDYEVKLPDTVKSIFAVEEAEDTQLKKAIELFNN